MQGAHFRKNFLAVCFYWIIQKVTSYSHLKIVVRFLVNVYCIAVQASFYRDVVQNPGLGHRRFLKSHIC